MKQGRRKIVSSLQSNRVLKKDHWLALVRFVTGLIDKLELDQPTNQSADNRSSLCDVSGVKGAAERIDGRRADRQTGRQADR